MPLVSFPHAGSLLGVNCGTGVWEWFFLGGGVARSWCHFSKDPLESDTEEARRKIYLVNTGAIGFLLEFQAPNFRVLGHWLSSRFQVGLYLPS